MCETTQPISTDARLVEIAFSMGRELGKLEGLWEARQIINEGADARDASEPEDTRDDDVEEREWQAHLDTGCPPCNLAHVIIAKAEGIYHV